MIGGSTHLYRQGTGRPTLINLNPSARPRTQATERATLALRPGFSSSELRSSDSVLGAVLPSQNPRKAASALAAVPSAAPIVTPSIPPTGAPAVHPRSAPQPSPKPTPAAKPAVVAKPAQPKPAQPKPAQPKPDPNEPALVSPPQTYPLPEPVRTAYQPPYDIQWAHSSNYGDRFVVDVYNRPIQNAPIIVLHETVAAADSVIATFQTPHLKEADQASYHSMIRRDGTIVYIVPPEKRAYGAGNSIFNGPNGPEAAKTHLKFPPSVNNFSYHISLESPPDGYGPGPAHSGYSSEQYQSLAWLVAQSRVPESRITTHQAVDRSGDRIDPRSFRRDYFLTLLRQLRGGPS